MAMSDFLIFWDIMTTITHNMCLSSVVTCSSRSITLVCLHFFTAEPLPDLDNFFKEHCASMEGHYRSLSNMPVSDCAMNEAVVPDHQQWTPIEAPGLTPSPSVGLPHHEEAGITDTSHLTNLYDEYRSNYNDANASNAACLQQAKTFALALLTHYYPASEGFIVAPCSPGPVAKHGMSFILNDSDKPDIRPFKPPHRARRGQRLNAKQKDENAAAKAHHQDQQQPKWHGIAANEIAAFVVQRQVSNTDVESISPIHLQNHTYLVIMIDEFDSVAQFSNQNILQRCDILTDLLCSQGRIQNGYGILLHGPLIEIYDFDRGIEFSALIHADEEQDIEPKMEVAADSAGPGKMVLDTRVAGLEELDGVLKWAIAREVTHVQDVVVGLSGDPVGEIVGCIEVGTAELGAEGSDVDVDAEGEDDDEAC
ncbi:hypothetical protein NX059_001565 [Plenodomus lindquistii]|nr:hypothetical protein NX059_001565 [Plenodomus lindquistii]